MFPGMINLEVNPMKLWGKEWTRAELTAGSKRIEGLEPGTDYRFTLYDGETAKGAALLLTTLADIIIDQREAETP